MRLKKKEGSTTEWDLNSSAVLPKAFLDIGVVVYRVEWYRNFKDENLKKLEKD